MEVEVEEEDEAYRPTPDNRSNGRRKRVLTDDETDDEANVEPESRPMAKRAKDDAHIMGTRIFSQLNAYAVKLTLVPPAYITKFSC